MAAAEHQLLWLCDKNGGRVNEGVCMPGYGKDSGLYRDIFLAGDIDGSILLIERQTALATREIVEPQNAGMLSRF